MTKSIVVTNAFRGYHKYEGAPKKVGFLSNVHRHVFNVKTTIEVFHNDRDIEFFQLQHLIDSFVKMQYYREWEQYIEGVYLESCESLAEAIVKYLQEVYPKRHIRVEVWEDNENGAIVEE